jgi:hypothetical protein
MSEISGGERLPLGQGSRASFFVSLTVGEVAFLIDPEGGEANWL